MLDHFNTALYLYLAPILSRVFFNLNDPIIELALAYGITALPISRILGTLIFGKLTVKFMPSKILFITLTGVSISTILIGLTPGYASIGMLAPIILILLRKIQTIFSSGETTIASYLLMELSDDDKRNVNSSYLQTSTMIGILIASIVSSLVYQSKSPEYYFRYAFIFGFITSIAAITIRIMFSKKNSIHEKPYYNTKKLKANNITYLQIIKEYPKNILQIAFIYGFSMMTYTIPFVLINIFVPLIREDISSSELLKNNSIFLIYDIFILYITAKYVSNKNYKFILASIISVFIIFSYPAFYIIKSKNIFYIELIRIIIITLGAVFSSSLNSIIFNICKGKNGSYMINASGIILGKSLLGNLAKPLILMIFYYSNNPASPAYYMIIISILALVGLLSNYKKL